MDVLFLLFANINILFIAPLNVDWFECQYSSSPGVCAHKMGAEDELDVVDSGIVFT